MRAKKFHTHILSWVCMSWQFCCDFMSPYNVGDAMSIRSLLSCVFCSWISGWASFVKSVTAAAARVVIVAAHLWIKQAAKKEAKATCGANCLCTVPGKSLNLSTSALTALMGTAASLISPKGCKVVRSKYAVVSWICVIILLITKAYMGPLGAWTVFYCFCHLIDDYSPMAQAEHRQESGQY